jgi:hypothetical protein
MAYYGDSSLFLILYTVDRACWTELQPEAGRYLHTGQYKHRHPRLKWDWNPGPSAREGGDGSYRNTETENLLNSRASVDVVCAVGQAIRASTLH